MEFILINVVEQIFPSLIQIRKTIKLEIQSYHLEYNFMK